MTRRIFTITLLLAIIAGTSWIFYQFKKINEQTPDALQYIPKNATTVLHLNTVEWNDFYTQARALSQLLSNEYRPLETYLNTLDSLRSQREGIQEMLDKGEKYLSFFDNNSDGKNWVFSMGLPNFKNDDYIRDLFSEIEFKDQHLKNTTIHFTRHISWAIIDHILLVSPNKDLLQENTFLNTTGENITTDSTFVSAYRTRGAGNIQLFTNKSINTYLFTEDQSRTWKSYETRIGQGMMDVYGYSFNERKNQFFFRPSALNLPLNIFPESQIKLESIQIDDISLALNQVVEKMVSENRINEYTDQLLAIETNCNCEAKAIAFNRSSAYGKFTNNRHQFAYLHYPNFNESAEEYLPLIKQQNLQEKDGFPIFELKYSNLYSVLLDQPGMDHLKYFTFRDNYLIFSPKIEDLYWLITQWKEAKTLANSEEFSKYSRHFQSISTWFYYDKNSGQKEVAYPFNIKNSSVVWQKDGGETHMVYNHVSFPTSIVPRMPAHTPPSPQATDTIATPNSYTDIASGAITTRLQEGATLDPTVVINHYTKEKEIFVQDQGNNVYLIDNKGKILWNKKIDGKILSPTRQIDVYRNGKLQLVFNTLDRIYCLDRNGKNVDGFPIKLKSKATSPLAVFDYDKKRKYRLVIGCEDKKIYNYTVEGKHTAGWRYQATDTPIVALEHLRIKGKDYLFTLSAKHRISILKRTGVVRFKSNTVATNYNRQGYAIEYNSKIEKTRMLYINTQGQLVRLTFDNTEEEILQSGFGIDAKLTYNDVDGDRKPDIIIADNQTLKAYGSDMKALFTIPVGAKTTTAPTIYPLNAKDIRIGITTSDKRFYLYNSLGEVVSGYPIDANQPIKIVDLDKDGEKERIITTGNTVEIN